MAKKNTPKLKPAAQKILNYLKEHVDIATFEARSWFDIVNVSARVSELRQAGYAVYCNKKDGMWLYRLGTPKRSVVAAGVQALASAKKRANKR